MRTLEILHAENLQVPFSASHYTQRNIALLQQSGAVTIHIQLYKTQKFTGHDQVDLEVSTVNSTVWVDAMICGHNENHNSILP